MYQLVLRFARRLAAKPDKTGIMKIPSQQEVIDTTNDVLTKFKKHNVPNEIIKTEDDVKKIFNQIQQIENQVFTKNLKQALTPHKSGDVVDLTGKKIDTSKPILGGKNVPEEKGFSMTIAEGPQTGKKITMDEFFEMSGSKTDSQIKSKLEGMNKKTVDRIRRRRYEAARKAEREKMAKDPDYIPKIIDPEDFAHGGRSGSGLNYLLGEDDQNSRVPYGGGGSGKPPIYGNPITIGHQGGMGFGGPKFTIPSPGKFGPFQVGIYGEGTKGEEIDQSKIGIGGQIDFGKGWTVKGAYDKSRIGIDSPYYQGVPVDDDAWGVEIEKRIPVDFNKMFMKDGGRIGFGLGGFNKARRLFLQAMGAGAAGVGAAKSGLFGLLKAGKPAVVETLTQVPIKDISGMPAWFKPLVNKVIKEGDDVTKKFATQERQIVHKTQLPDSKTDVLVTQDLNTGHVSVDIGLTKHGFADGHLGQPVRLEYKAAEVIEPPIIKEGKVAGHGKGTKTKEEFNVEEAEFTGGHPENIKFEESTINKFGEHGSDFTEVEKFATGKVKKAKPSIKAERSHWVPEGDDMASGGRVPMVFGGRTIGVLKNLLTKQKKKLSIPRGEKSLRPDIFAKSIMSEEDKLKLLQLETRYADSLLESLKIDRQLFKQLQSNEAMKDEGLDFLMKHFVDTQAPHMKNYKSLADIDQAILELETLVKNKMLKEGRKPHATGGRVPLSAGGVAGMLGE